MQSRFKFRVWNTQTQTMHYNDFCVTATGYVAPLQTQDHKIMSFNQYDLKPDENNILMQCTGMMDKQKRYIYEGDILKETYTSEGETHTDITVVKYNKSSAGFIMARPGLEKDVTWFDEINLDKEDFIIIGNIYETPEKLEETEE